MDLRLKKGVDNVQLSVGGTHHDDARQRGVAQRLNLLLESHQFWTVPQLASRVLQEVHVDKVAQDVDGDLVIVRTCEMVPHDERFAHGLVGKGLAPCTLAKQVTRLATQWTSGVLE